MAKAKDLTGERFGKLTVLRLGDPARSPGGKAIRRWVCRCDCGREITVNQNSLTGKNGTRSCGCSRGDALRVDMTGQRFGRLTVTGPAPLPKTQSNGQQTGWACKCDCGNTYIATRKTLLSGKAQSCGCLLRETATKKMVVDNVNKKYDGTMISAISPDRKPNANNTSGIKGVYWSKREAGASGKDVGLQKSAFGAALSQ